MLQRIFSFFEGEEQYAKITFFFGKARISDKKISCLHFFLPPYAPSLTDTTTSQPHILCPCGDGPPPPNIHPTHHPAQPPESQPQRPSPSNPSPTPLLPNSYHSRSWAGVDMEKVLRDSGLEQRKNGPFRATQKAVCLPKKTGHRTKATPR